MYIVLVDSKDRRKKVRRTIESVCRQCVLVELRAASEKVKLEGFEGEVAFSAVHINDLLPDENGADVVHESVRKLLESSRVVIAYTGGAGGVDTDMVRRRAAELGYRNAERWYGISEEVSDSGYDADGMREVVEWAASERAAERVLPRLLRRPDTIEWMRSLCFLCQGFLAHHMLGVGDLENNDKYFNERPDLLDALKLMGLGDVEERRLLSQTVRSVDTARAEELLDQQYWISPFGAPDYLRRRLELEFFSVRGSIEKLIQDGVVEVRSGTRLSRAIDALTSAVEVPRGSEHEFVGLVSRAYLELDLILKVAGC